MEKALGPLHKYYLPFSLPELYGNLWSENLVGFPDIKAMKMWGPHWDFGPRSLTFTLVHTQPPAIHQQSLLVPISLRLQRSLLQACRTKLCLSGCDCLLEYIYIYIQKCSHILSVHTEQWIFTHWKSSVWLAPRWRNTTLPPHLETSPTPRSTTLYTLLIIPEPQKITTGLTSYSINYFGLF